MPIPVSLFILLFTLAEIAAFVLVGRALGGAATFGLMLLAVVAGVMILRWGSMATVMRVRSELAAGRAPAGPVFDGALVGLGALLFIVPGFLTDLAGLALLIPGTRRTIASRLRRRSGRASAPRPQRAASAVVELGPGEYLAYPHRDNRQSRGPAGADRPATE